MNEIEIKRKIERKKEKGVHHQSVVAVSDKTENQIKQINRFESIKAM